MFFPSLPCSCAMFCQISESEICTVSCKTSKIKSDYSYYHTIHRESLKHPSRFSSAKHSAASSSGNEPQSLRNHGQFSGNEFNRSYLGSSDCLPWGPVMEKIFLDNHAAFPLLLPDLCARYPFTRLGLLIVNL